MRATRALARSAIDLVNFRLRPRAALIFWARVGRACPRECVSRFSTWCAGTRRIRSLPSADRVILRSDTARPRAGRVADDVTLPVRDFLVPDGRRRMRGVKCRTREVRASSSARASLASSGAERIMRALARETFARGGREARRLTRFARSAILLRHTPLIFFFHHSRERERDFVDVPKFLISGGAQKRKGNLLPLALSRDS